MRIGVISDTHIPVKAKHIPHEILGAFKKVEMVIHAGDMVDLQAIEELRSVCANVVAVSGNMDNEEVKNKYPDKLLLTLGKFKVALMHGFGAPQELPRILKDVFKQDKPDMIIFGHSHNPMNEKIGGTIFFNPGSATDKINAAYNSYGIIEIDDKIDAKIIRLENG